MNNNCEIIIYQMQTIVKLRQSKFDLIFTVF